MPIYFYSTIEEYGCFSNFAPYGIEMEGRYWVTIEHYFQAMKFTDQAYQEKIARARTPKEAKILGRKRRLPIRPGWDEVRNDVMRKAVLQKFRTHPAIREILLATGEEELLENSPADYYWGCGKTGTGSNMLGQILMEVREILRNEVSGSPDANS